MKLKDVLSGVNFSSSEVCDVDISDIAYNSAAAREGTVFVALRGAMSDGHKYCADAYARGCRVFCVEYMPEFSQNGCLFLVCEDTRVALSKMSANLFRHPDREVKVVGITGTNGKTTQTYMLCEAFKKAGAKAGVIGTNGAVYGDIHIPTSNTTPESYEMQRILREFADAGCEYVFTEVSSLGIKQHRVDDVNYFAAVFTNFSSDHVGGAEHSTVEEYLDCKLHLFTHCDNAVLNIDDIQFERFKAVSACNTVTYGTSKMADFRANDIAPYRNGGIFGVSAELFYADGKTDFTVSMAGKFSVYNALVVFAVCTLCGVSVDSAKKALANIQVDGRLQHMKIPDGADVFIDYAHNADGVENILKTLSEYNPKKLIVVFGCVGSRAQIRRRGVGTAAGLYSDFAVVTTDDPAFESPEEIVDEVVSYVREACGECVGISDRSEAVQYACKMSREGDFIAILGKGHETAMKVNGKTVPYSDAGEVEKFVKAAEMQRSALKM